MYVILKFSESWLLFYVDYKKNGYLFYFRYNSALLIIYNKNQSQQIVLYHCMTSLINCGTLGKFQAFDVPLY